MKPCFILTLAQSKIELLVVHLSLLLPMLLILNLNHSIEKHLWENREATWSPIFREIRDVYVYNPVISISWSYSSIAVVQLSYLLTHLLLGFNFCISKINVWHHHHHRLCYFWKQYSSEYTSQNTSGKLIEADSILKVKIYFAPQNAEHSCW